MSGTYNFELALRAGLAGGGIVFALWQTARIMGIHTANFLTILGVAVSRKNDHTTDMIGFFVHLAISGFAGLIYGAVFWLWGDAGLLRGLAISAPHFILTAAGFGVALNRIPLLRDHKHGNVTPDFPLHPIYPIAIFLVLHAVFGLSMGALYRM